jgi:metallo-beta-lactamase class B
MDGRLIAVVLIACMAGGPVAAASERVELEDGLFLEPIVPGVWRHVSTKEMEGWGRIAANGLLVVSSGEAALIDTPWTDDQVRALARWLEAEQHAMLTIAVPTHWHDDCLGGLAAAHELGAASYASKKTIELARKGGAVVPENGFEGRLDLSVGTTIVSLQEVGPGHTIDNIVAWLPEDEVLFGGCLVKGAKSGLGYIEEADMKRWPETVRAVAKTFDRAKIVVPGHGAPGGLELLEHTAVLVSRP